MRTHKQVVLAIFFIKAYHTESQTLQHYLSYFKVWPFSSRMLWSGSGLQIPLSNFYIWSTNNDKRAGMLLCMSGTEASPGGDIFIYQICQNKMKSA